jgi:transcriptional regulator with XRE-family HTH domain
MSRLSTIKRKWMRDRAVRAGYEALGDEFTLAAALIDARARADLTQEEVARRMETTQAYVARMEGGRINPSVKTLKRFAAATGSKLKIEFEADRHARPNRSAGPQTPAARGSAIRPPPTDATR